jgi:hypothetical protein
LDQKHPFQISIKIIQVYTQKTLTGIAIFPSQPAFTNIARSTGLGSENRCENRGNRCGETDVHINSQKEGERLGEEYKDNQR